jgi:hypothetical protein
MRSWNRLTTTVAAAVALAAIAPCQTIDVVGSTSNTATGTGLAKGNSYVVNVPTINLVRMEFWLTFTTTATLSFYVYSSPVEFGTYTQIYTSSATVTGTGSAWYSSPPLVIPLTMGNHYILAVSWTGTVTYYFGVGDTQPTSFGAHTHGYATGLNPLPLSFSSTVNDQAIYHQRVSTLLNNYLSVSQTGPLVGDVTLSLTNPSTTGYEGWTLLSSNTALPVGSGPILGLWPDALTWSILGYPYFPGNPFHFRTGDAGLFPNVPFTAPPGSVSALAGQSFDFAVFLINANLGYDSRSNTVRYTFQ